MEQRSDHGHPEVRLDCACMERATEDRESSTSVDRFVKDRRVVARSTSAREPEYRWTVSKLVIEVIRRGVQTLMVKSDQEATSVDVKSSLMGELRSVEGSTIVSEESSVGANAANPMIDKGVWEMQIVVTALDANAEWMYSTTSDPGGAILTWTVEIVGHVVSRSRSGVSDERTACERRTAIQLTQSVGPV